MGGAERNRFEKYLRSPYHNERPEMLALFLALRENPVLADDRPKLWAALFPQKKFDDPKCRRTLSELCRLALDFWSLEKGIAKNGSWALLAAENLLDHQLSEAAAATLKAVLRDLDGLPGQDASVAELRFNAEQLLVACRPDARKAPAHTGSRRRALDHFYHIQSLKLLTEQLNYARIVQRADDDTDGQRAFLLEKKFEDPVPEAWRLAACSYADEENEAHVAELLALLRDKADCFSRDDRFQLYVIAQNFCIRRLNAGESRFLDTLLDLYESRMAAGLLTVHGELPHGEFKNMVTSALHGKAFDRAERFVRELSGLLAPNIRENAFTYNLAKLHFEKGEYHKALELLRDVTYEDIFYAVGSRWMLLRAYYEMGEYVAFDALLDSFRHFLRRSKALSAAHQKEYLNALRFIQKLAKLDPRDKKGRANFREAVQKAPSLYGKRWFLAQV